MTALIEKLAPENLLCYQDNLGQLPQVKEFLSSRNNSEETIVEQSARCYHHQFLTILWDTFGLEHQEMEEMIDVD